MYLSGSSWALVQPGCTIQSHVRSRRATLAISVALVQTDLSKTLLWNPRQILVNGHQSNTPFRRDSGKRFCRYLVEGFQILSLQNWPARTSHKYCPNSTNRSSRSRSFVCSQCRIRRSCLVRAVHVGDSALGQSSVC